MSSLSGQADDLDRLIAISYRVVMPDPNVGALAFDGQHG